MIDMLYERLPLTRELLSDSETEGEIFIFSPSTASGPPSSSEEGINGNLKYIFLENVIHNLCDFATLCIALRCDIT